MFTAVCSKIIFLKTQNAPGLHAQYHCKSNNLKNKGLVGWGFFLWGFFFVCRLSFPFFFLFFFFTVVLKVVFIAACQMGSLLAHSSISVPLHNTDDQCKGGRRPRQASP